MARGGGHGLLRTLYVKIGSALLTLFFVLVFNFFLFRVLPADPAKNLTRNNALTASQLAAINKTVRPRPAAAAAVLELPGADLRRDLGLSFSNQGAGRPP